MGSIRVIGLGGRSQEHNWHQLVEGRAVVARSTAVGSASLHSRAVPGIRYDGMFDGDDVARVAEAIVGDIRDLSAGSDVAYLVPGPGNIGDITVEVLTAAVEAEIVPGALPAVLAGSAVTVIDALALAAAESAQPFDAGLAPIEPLTTTVVTNWYGTQVTSLAAERLRRHYGIDVLPAPDTDGNLILPARRATDAPPSVDGLRHIYARLRRPDGCPWDREQTAMSLLPALREEVEEFTEAIIAGDNAEAAEELGDVIGNTIMIAQIEAERGAFQFGDAIGAVTAKLVRRHPHVFGDLQATSAEDVLGIWNQVKQQEKQRRNAEGREQ